MASIEMWNLQIKELEDIADKVKACVLDALVHDKLLSYDAADKWAQSHTPLLVEKSIWRTISDKFSKEKKDDDTKYYWKIVSDVTWDLSVDCSEQKLSVRNE